MTDILARFIYTTRPPRDSDGHFIGFVRSSDETAVLYNVPPRCVRAVWARAAFRAITSDLWSDGERACEDGRFLEHDPVARPKRGRPAGVQNRDRGGVGKRCLEDEFECLVCCIPVASDNPFEVDFVFTEEFVRECLK